MTFDEATRLFAEAVQSMKNRVLIDVQAGRVTLAAGGRIIGAIEAGAAIVKAWPELVKAKAAADTALEVANDRADYWRTLFQIMLMRGGHFVGNPALFDEDEATRSAQLFLNVGVVLVDGVERATFQIADPPTADELARAH